MQRVRYVRLCTVMYVYVYGALYKLLSHHALRDFELLATAVWKSFEKNIYKETSLESVIRLPN